MFLTTRRYCLLLFLGAFLPSNMLIANDGRGVVESAANGNWTDPETWQGEHVPTAGDTVLVRSDHEVVYDSNSDEVVRSVHISGTLRFHTDADTQLNVGLLRIEGGDRVVEEGFHCDVHEHHHRNSASPAKAFAIDEAGNVESSAHHVRLRQYVDKVESSHK